MAEGAKKPLTVVPKQAQIPLLIIGIPLLLYVGWSFATQMGWIGGPPHAKRPVTVKKPAGATQPGSTAGTRPGETAEATGPGARPGTKQPQPVANLDAIRAPARDPMAESGAAAGPPASGPKPPGPSATGGTAPRVPPPTNPPLPPPMAPAGGFPPPTTGPRAPGAAPPVFTAPAAPPVHSLPGAFGVQYPIARRGTLPASRPTPVELLGTISGSRGTMAVVHRTDTSSPRGVYVREGDAVGGDAHRVESISPGKMKLSGRGGTRELTVRPRPSSPPPPAESAPAATQTRTGEPSAAGTKPE